MIGVGAGTAMIIGDAVSAPPSPHHGVSDHRHAATHDFAGALWSTRVGRVRPYFVQNAAKRCSLFTSYPVTTLVRNPLASWVSNSAWYWLLLRPCRADSVAGGF